MPIIPLNAVFGCTCANPILLSSCHTFLLVQIYNTDREPWKCNEVLCPSCCCDLLGFVPSFDLAPSDTHLWDKLKALDIRLLIYSRNVQMHCCYPESGAAGVCWHASATYHCRKVTFSSLWWLLWCTWDKKQWVCLHYIQELVCPWHVHWHRILNLSFNSVWPMQTFYVIMMDMKYKSCQVMHSFCLHILHPPKVAKTI